MISILEALEEANKATKIKTFSYANLQEFNSFLDSFKGLDFPAHVIVPIPLTGTLLNNRAKDIITVQGWMLTRLNEDTNNWRSQKIEQDYINPMRVLARKFMVNLANSDIVDTEQEPITYNIRPEYMFLHAHTFGVSYTISLPILSNVCT